MLVTLLLSAVLQSASACPAPATYKLEPGAPVPIVWCHDGQRAPKFRIWRSGSIVLNTTTDMLTVEPLDAKQCGEESVACFRYALKPGLLAAITAPGTYTFQVTAFNDFGEAPKSDPVTVVVGWASAPSKALGVVIRD